MQMQIYPNGTLITFLEGTKNLPVVERLQRRLQLFDKLLHTVAWLHQAGVSHRDLKPSNILLDTDMMPVLADFEISRDDDIHAATTTVGVSKGTYPWMAPEVTSFCIYRVSK